MKHVFYALVATALTLSALAAQQPPAAPAPPQGQNPPAAAPAPAGKGIIEGTVTRAGTNNLPVKNAQVTVRSVATNATLNTQVQQFLAARGGRGGRGGQGGQDFTAILEALPLDQIAGLAQQRGGFNGLANGGLTGNIVGRAVVDSSGHFKVTGLVAGEYRVFAESDGYIRQEYGQRTPMGAGIPFALAEDKPFEVNFQLTQGGVISGRVVDPDGEALNDAFVVAYTYAYSEGKRSLNQVANAQTNDRGEYRLFYLMPGDYFVAVNPPAGTLEEPGANSAQGAQQQGFPGGGRGGGRGGRGGFDPGPGGRGALTPVYYPGTIDPTQASAIPVGPAARIEGIDINLRPVRMVTLSGRVDTPFPLASDQNQRAAIDQLRTQLDGRGGNPGQRGNPNDPQQGGRGGRGGGNEQDFRRAIEAAANGGSAQVSLSRVGESQNPLGRLDFGGRGGDGTRVQPDGTFSIANVVPGAYNLTATARDQAGQQYTARARVDVGSSDLPGISIPVRPGVEVRGQLYAEGAPGTFKMSQVRVNLTADDSPLAGVAATLVTTITTALAAQPNNGGGPNIAEALGNSGQVATGQVADDGSFTLKNVGSIEYRVRLSGLPTGAYLKAARIGDIDPLRAPFVISDPKSLLQIQIGFGLGKVTGAVLDAESKAVPGVVAALVPEAAQRGRTDLYFSGTTDRAGHVTFANVPPGSYKLFAWEEIPTGAFQYPDFIRAFEDRGQAVVVEQSREAQAQTRVIPAVTR